MLLFCVTSSRGLCGGYNANHPGRAGPQGGAAGQGREALLAVIGRKGLAVFPFPRAARGVPVPDTDENIPFTRVDEIMTQLFERYAAQEFDAVELVTTRYKTRAVQEVRIEPLLPFTPPSPGRRHRNRHGGTARPRRRTGGNPCTWWSRIGSACSASSCPSW